MRNIQIYGNVFLFAKALTQPLIGLFFSIYHDFTNHHALNAYSILCLCSSRKIKKVFEPMRLAFIATERNGKKLNVFNQFFQMNEHS